jgi:hypothetical protein
MGLDKDSHGRLVNEILWSDLAFRAVTPNAGPCGLEFRDGISCDDAIEF